MRAAIFEQVVGRLDGNANGDSDQAALRLVAREGGALCTVVGIEGSWSRRLGAQLAIAPDGAMAGCLADGCLEHELVKQAEAARTGRQPRLLRYGKGSPYVDFRLPCGSGIDVLVDPAPDRAALASVVARLDSRDGAALVLPVGGGKSDLLRVRGFTPALRILAFGAGPEVDALQHLGAAYGADVIACAPGERLGLGRAPVGLEVDRWTAIVSLFHDHDWERGLLPWALGTSAFFIGAIGGRGAREQRRAFLADAGYDSAQISRIASPIGVIPATREAPALALSALAEIVAQYEQVRL